jgi:hypothetical protein
MIYRPFLAIAFAIGALSGLAGPAWSQAAAGKSAHALDLDAGPSTGSAPDPLAPPEVTGPAPAAPGAPTVTGQADGNAAAVKQAAAVLLDMPEADAAVAYGPTIKALQARGFATRRRPSS